MGIQSVRSLQSAVVLGVAMVATLGGVWIFWTHQQGLANLQACGSIEPGGQRSSLIQTFGAPRTSKANLAGTRLVLSFTSPIFTDKPIRAVVNVRDDVVMEIDCGDGRIQTYDKY